MSRLRILLFAAAALGRSRLRTLSVVVVYGLLVGLVASLLLYADGLRRQARLVLEGTPEILVQRLRGGRHRPLTADHLAGLGEIRGVTAVTPRLWGTVYDPAIGANLTVWAAASVPPAVLEHLEGGSGGGSGEGVCLVGVGLAEHRFLDVGDRLPLLTADGDLVAPRVTGVFRADSAILTNDLVVLQEDLARGVLGYGPGEWTDVALGVRNPAEVDTVITKLRLAGPDLRVVTRRQIEHTYDAVFDWRSGLWAAALIPAVLAFAILVWTQGTGLSAEELRTVGLLRAVGWSTREVLLLKLCEGTLVSAAAAIAGLLLAQAHLLLAGGALFTRVLRGWSVLFPQLEVAPVASPTQVLGWLALVVLPYALASLVPAWRAAVTEPDAVLRG